MLSTKKFPWLATLALLGTTGGAASVAFAAPACGSIVEQQSERPYTLIIGNTSTGQCATVQATTAKEFVDAFKTSSIHGLFPGSNTNVDGYQSEASFNSLLTQMSFAPASSSLTFTIPELGIREAFDGGTRDASTEQLKDYLKKNNVMGRIMNYQAKNSPFSPITGQGGLIPNTLSADFDTGFADVATQVSTQRPTQEGGSSNQFQAAAGAGFGKVGSVDTKFFTIPLSYAFRNDIDPRRQLIVQLPLTYSDVGGSKSVQAGLGVAYRLPMSDQWTLTPNIKYSAVGSADLATVAGLYSASLSSTYIFSLKGFDLAIGNMLGIYKTGKFSSGDYAFNPGVTTYGMRNGIMLLQPVTISGNKLSLEYSFIDTRYFGDKPFADNSQEINITLGTNKSAYSARSFLRAGAGYVHSKSGNSWKLNLGYWF